MGSSAPGRDESAADDVLEAWLNHRKSGSAAKDASALRARRPAATGEGTPLKDRLAAERDAARGITPEAREQAERRQALARENAQRLAEERRRAVLAEADRAAAARAAAALAEAEQRESQGAASPPGPDALAERRAEEEAARLEAETASARRRAEEEARQRAEAEAAEARRLAEAEETARREAEAAEARRRAEEEARQRAEAEAAEARRLAEAEETARREAEARRRADEEAARREAFVTARREAEAAEAQRVAAAGAADSRTEAEREMVRKAAEDEARRLAFATARREAEAAEAEEARRLAKSSEQAPHADVAEADDAPDSARLSSPSEGPSTDEPPAQQLTRVEVPLVADKPSAAAPDARTTPGRRSRRKPADPPLVPLGRRQQRRKRHRADLAVAPVEDLTRRRSGQGLLVLLMLASLGGAGYFGAVGWQHDSTTALGIAVIMAGLAAVLWVVRISTTPPHMRVDNGLLDVELASGRMSFDLRSQYTRVTLRGRPGQRRWRVRLEKEGQAAFVVDASKTNPHDFMRVLTYYRPELRQDRRHPVG